MENFLNIITTYLTNFGLNLIYAALVLFCGTKLIKWLTKSDSKISVFMKMDESVARFLKSVISVLLYTLLFFSAAIILGIPGTTLVTVLGSAGLAIGLSLQGSLTNIAGSLILMIFKPYKIGDTIEYGSIKGTVTDINLFYTVLTTVDNKVITCPNGSLSNSNITNYSANDTRRVDIVFSADYSADSTKVMMLIRLCAEHNKSVLETPAPEVLMTKLADSAVEYTLRAWVKSEDYFAVMYGLTEEVKRVFDASGVSIPYPQMDVHIKNDI